MPVGWMPENIVCGAFEAVDVCAEYLRRNGEQMSGRKARRSGRDIFGVRRADLRFAAFFGMF